MLFKKVTHTLSYWKMELKTKKGIFNTFIITAGKMQLILYFRKRSLKALGRCSLDLRRLNCTSFVKEQGRSMQNVAGS